MRSYIDRKNSQKKVYFSDRFYKLPSLPRESVSSDDIFNSDLEKLKSTCDVLDAYIEAGQLVIWIKSIDNVKVLEFFKNELSYNNLTEMSAIDFLANRGEFEIFYQMLSMKKRKRARIKCTLNENETLKSVISLYKSADWAEREMYDMFGVVITGHPYMKRMLLPDDWVGHPLRKSYPLQGDENAQWYEVDQIFGKEYRDVIGPEIRDAALIDKNNTRAYARKDYEVEFDTKYSEDKTNFNEYQEEQGVLLVSKFKKDKTTILKKRR